MNISFAQLLSPLLLTKQLKAKLLSLKYLLNNNKYNSKKFKFLI